MQRSYTVCNATIGTLLHSVLNMWIPIVGTPSGHPAAFVHPSFIFFPIPSLQILRKGKILLFSKSHTERESAGKGRRHVTQIVSMPTELSKLCPLIIHWREHKSFSAVVSMEGNISFQFDSFPAKAFVNQQLQHTF